MVVDAGTEQPTPQWQSHKHWSPECMQTIFSMPLSATPCAKPQRQTVVDEMAVDLSRKNCNPTVKGKSGIAVGAEAVTSSFERLLEEDSQ